MKKLYQVLTILVFLSGGCTLIEDIFEAGFWVGLIAAIVAVLVIWLIVKIIKAIAK